MELTESVVRDRAREYAEVEPLYDVEQQHVDILPETFAGGEFGRRDVQWVVRWYFRRYLGAYPDRDRREVEAAFRDNDFGVVLETLEAVATDAEESDEALALLTDLTGVDVPVASAFLQFVAPERYVTVDERTWRVLRAAGELDDPYPDPPGIAAYRTFDSACLRVGDRTGVDAWTLYRALWRLWAAEFGDA
ncbi:MULTISPECIES: hypothetical protein [Haloarcula]|uniref:hypothetical protein n=1 Tax=Haloarcula TaxID=2237 RepID=UPI0023EBEFD7|nr:hypothetical protein [Halomicroarcula sp. XH51]